MQCMNRCKIPSPRFYPPNNTKGRNNFTKLYTVLFPPPSCHSCTNNHADSPLLHYVTIQFEFSGPLFLPSSDRNQMESSRQASGRNELLQFADRCNILLELSLGTSPSPPLSSQTFPIIFSSWPLARPVLQFFLLTSYFFVTPVFWVILVAMAMLAPDTHSAL
jgi:hypothetical protein